MQVGRNEQMRQQREIYPTLADIPHELSQFIFSFLRPVDCLNVRLTSRRYKQLISNEFWLEFRRQYLPIFHTKKDFYTPFLEGSYFAAKLSKLSVLELLYAKNINPRICYLYFNEEGIYILNSNSGITRVPFDTMYEEKLRVADVCFIRCMTVAGSCIYVASQYRNSIAIYSEEGNSSTDDIYKDITSLAVHQTFLFALERHRIVAFDLIAKQSTVIKRSSYTFCGQMSFFERYFFVCYTDGSGNFGFLAKNIQTKKNVKGLCLGLGEEFFGYELLGSDLILRFKDGKAKVFNLKTFEEKVFIMNAKIIKVIKSLNEYWFFCLDENSFPFICDESGNVLFKIDEVIKREKRLCFYKGYLILGLRSENVEVWNVMKQERLLQFKPFSNYSAITGVRIISDKLIVTSSLGQLHVYNLDLN